MSHQWDVFISHAFEDKEAFVRPLAVALQALGVSVWYDEFTLRLGDSLSGSIDKGLAGSTYGLVIISPSFVTKKWTEYELRGLVSREISEDRVIIPVWYGIGRNEVVAFSPTLADKLAVVDARALAVEEVAIRVLKAVRPDLYGQHPRHELERLATGQALEVLKQERDNARTQLERVREDLQPFQCPTCGSPLLERSYKPGDDGGAYSVYECGSASFDFGGDRLCPSDPRFPHLSDFELRTDRTEMDPPWNWLCIPVPKTALAWAIQLSSERGMTEEDAKQRVIGAYEKAARRWTPSG